MHVESAACFTEHVPTQHDPELTTASRMCGFRRSADSSAALSACTGGFCGPGSAHRWMTALSSVKVVQDTHALGGSCCARRRTLPFCGGMHACKMFCASVRTPAFGWPCALATFGSSVIWHLRSTPHTTPGIISPSSSWPCIKRHVPEGTYVPEGLQAQALLEAVLVVGRPAGHQQLHVAVLNHGWRRGEEHKAH
jgi:hypothetical protein